MSPLPRGWPGVFASDAALKEYIVKKLGGRRVRLTEPAHPMGACEARGDARRGLRETVSPPAG